MVVDVVEYKFVDLWSEIVCDADGIVKPLVCHDIKATDRVLIWYIIWMYVCL